MTRDMTWYRTADAKEHLAAGSPPQEPPVLFREGAWAGDVRQGQSSRICRCMPPRIMISALVCAVKQHA
jgi:hypothetical protein